MTPPLFSEAELRRILSRGEGQFFEFKSAWMISSRSPTAD